jgi:hypothetical protein
VRQVTDDYRALLANPDVEAVYIAVPHHLHAEMYGAAITAGKHLMGEKPFGIDQTANRAICARAAERADLLVRCSSESPFFRRCSVRPDAGRGRVRHPHRGRNRLSARSDLDPEKTDQLEAHPGL